MLRCGSVLNYWPLRSLRLRWVINKHTTMHGRDGTNLGPAGETPSLEHGVLGPRPKQAQSSLPGSVGLVVGRSAAATTELVMMLVVLLLR